MKTEDKKKEPAKSENDTNKNPDEKKKVNDGKEKNEENKNEIKPQTMHKGDYNVHILLEEVRKMENKSESQLPEPMIKIKCFGQIKKIRSPENKGTDFIIGEHFYFEKENMTIEQLDSEKIVIEVYDEQFTKRNEYIGIYECDFQSIYNNPKHASQNFWIALINPESDDFTKVRGFLRLSISVLHESDSIVDLTSSTDKADSVLILPPQINLKYKQLIIHVVQADDLPDMDSSVSDMFDKNKKKDCDCVLMFEFMGTKLPTTEKKMEGREVKIKETIYIPLVSPIVSSKLKMTAVDNDPIGFDVIGTYEIDINNLNRYDKWQYIHIYGAPLNFSGNFYNLMNENAEIGSLWKGKILMKLECDESPSIPKCMVSPMDSLVAQSAGTFIKNNRINWTLYVTLFGAYFIPENKKYKIKVFYENSQVQMKEFESKNTFIDFGNYKTDSKIIQTTDSTMNQLSDLFIYLVENDKNICFQRINLQNIPNNKDPLVIKLIPDPVIGEIKESRNAGLVKMSINIFKDGDPKNYVHYRDSGSSQKNDKADHKNYYVVANIYQSRYLIAGDSNGTSDPFVILKINESRKETTIKNDTINPIWNEYLIFEDLKFNINDFGTWPLIYCEVEDYDMFEKNDCLGYCYIWLNEANYLVNNTDANTIDPKWFQLYLPLSNRPQGQLLISFMILEKEKYPDIDSIKKTLKICPKTTLYEAEINCLGLRDILPLSLLPVKKPYIVFDVNGINFQNPDEKSNNMITSVKTLPKESGPNPNINTILKFDVNLPNKSIFVPQLQCLVNDYMLAGLVNPLLGVFLINVNEVIEFHKSKFEQDLQKLEKKIAEISDPNYLNQKKEREMKEKELMKMKEEVLKKTDLTKQDARISINKDTNLKEKLISNDVNDPSLPPKEKNNFQEEEKKIKLQEIELVSLPQDKNNNANENIQRVYSGFTIQTQIDIVRERDRELVIKPIYKKYKVPGVSDKSVNYKEYNVEDDDRSKLPDPALYRAIGYNKDITDNEKMKKHYRRYFDQELEKCLPFGMKSPFQTFQLRRGKYSDNSKDFQIFEALKNQEAKIFKSSKILKTQKTVEEIKNEQKEEELAQMKMDKKSYGMFKGLVKIIDKNLMTKANEMIKTLTDKNEYFEEEYPYFNQYHKLSQDLLSPKDVVLRLYILDVKDIKSKDVLSPSDPFFKIYFGDQVIDDQKNYVNDVIEYSPCKVFQITGKLPGASILRIELWDYDPLFSDELIGYTTIDVEDRFYDKNWRNLKFKPIETRKMMNDESNTTQANMTMWLEIVLEKQKKLPLWDISPPPIKEMELRVIVWETEGIKLGDVEETSDIYVTANVNEKEKAKSTDVHWRCQNGAGSFNWRILLPVNYPSIYHNLHVKVFDSDFLKSDDFLGGNRINIEKLLKNVYELDIPLHFNKSYYEEITKFYNEEEKKYIEDIDFNDSKEDKKFWLQMYDNEMKKEGKVLLSVELVPKWKSELSKVGFGREDPNINPTLPPPTGRVFFSWNPFEMFGQLVGPGIRKRIYLACCCILLIICLIVALPYLGLNILGAALNPFKRRILIRDDLYLN